MKITLLQNSNRTAIVGANFQYKYPEIYARAVKAKAALGSDVKHVAIFGENAPSWVFAVYGAWMTEAAVIPIDAKSSVDEVAFILSDARPEAICVSAENLETAKQAAAKLDYTPKFVSLDEIAEGEVATPPSDWTLECESEDLAFIVYTSGTTGNPKGVMLTFANMYANMKAVAEAKYYADGVRVLILLPFHHILPLMGTMVMPLSVRGKMVFPRSISPVDIAEVLSKHPVDMVIGVPRFYELLHGNIMAKIGASKLAKTLFSAARLARSAFISKKIFGAIHRKFGGEVKFWISGGAALDRKVWRDLDTLGFGMREGYGMTECAPIIAFPRIGHIKIGSPGQALPGVEVRIVDGEIVVRGGNVTQGYYNRPEETSETIRNGWLYTGDLGYVDDDGFIFITGRRKEIIVLANGKNLNPAEMESQLKAQNPEIIEAGVLMYENMLQAIIRVSPQMLETLGEDEAREFIRNNAVLPYNRATATYKRIISFVLTADELPRTRVGKLKRYHLASYIENISNQKPVEKSPEPNSDVYVNLRSVIASQISVPIRPDAHMEMDLGLDSLGKISVQCFVKENYGVDVSERDFEKYPTLRKFSEFVDKERDSSFEATSKDITWSDIIKAEPTPILHKPHFFHFAIIIFFRAFARIFYKMRIDGTEHLPPDGISAIIAPNHQTYLDGLFIINPFTKTQIYKSHFFAKIRSIIKDGFIRKLADRSNFIVMDINDNVSESIRKMAQALRQGNRVVIFPEGTRTKDGKIAEFKQSFAILAKEMSVPVIPVAISGGYEALKEGATIPNFGSEIFIKFLPPMRPEAEESYEDFAARVRKAVETEWEKLNARR